MLDDRGLFQLADIGVCGQPYHGLCQGGFLTLPNSETIMYPQPPRGSSRLLRVPGVADPVLTPEETARATLKGLQWLPYAYIGGGAAHESEIFANRNAAIYGKTIFEAADWLWAQTNGAVWRVSIAWTPNYAGTTQTFNVTFKRFGYVGEDVIFPIRTRSFTRNVGAIDFVVRGHYIDISDATDTGNKAVLRIIDRSFGVIIEHFECTLTGLCEDDTVALAFTTLDTGGLHSISPGVLTELDHVLGYWYNNVNERQKVSIHYAYLGSPLEEYLTITLRVGGAVRDTVVVSCVDGLFILDGVQYPPENELMPDYTIGTFDESAGTIAPTFQAKFPLKPGPPGSGQQFDYTEQGRFSGVLSTNKVASITVQRIPNSYYLPAINYVRRTWFDAIAPHANSLTRLLVQDTLSDFSTIVPQYFSYDPATYALTRNQTTPVCYV